MKVIEGLLTTLVPVRWSRKLMSQISESNLQEYQIIETLKEEGSAVSTQETAARKNKKIGCWTHLPAPRTKSRQRPFIFNEVAGRNQ
jgi:hypothetical protein